MQVGETRVSRFTTQGCQTGLGNYPNFWNLTCIPILVGVPLGMLQCILSCKFWILSSMMQGFGHCQHSFPGKQIWQGGVILIFAFLSGNVGLQEGNCSAPFRKAHPTWSAEMPPLFAVFDGWDLQRIYRVTQLLPNRWNSKSLLWCTFPFPFIWPWFDDLDR